MIIEIITIIFFYNGWNIKDLSVFTLTQGTIFQFWTPNSLRGYGCGTPNGTLWTMCVTIQFYLIAWPVHKMLKDKKIFYWSVFVVISIILSAFGFLIFDSFHKEILTKLYNQTIIRYGWLFLTGCFISKFKKNLLHIIIRFWYILLLLGLVPYISNIDIFVGYGVIRNIFMTVGLIGFAYRFPKLALKKDISYAIFLYHMIIVNIFITIGWTEKWLYGLIAMSLTVFVAYVSTVTIGKWAAKRKIQSSMFKA